MHRPNIGLALGSGAARGGAHIGVLKAFEEEGIYPDMVAGTSAGALIGGLYCAGVDVKTMAAIARSIHVKELFDLTVPRVGFIKGNKIEALIGLLTRNFSIEELKIPFRAVSTDLSKGEKFVFDRGPVSKAVRASISIPCVFVPVHDGDRVLVDGAIMERVPAGTVREMGADYVIGVDVGFSAPKGKAGSIFDVIFQTIDTAERELLKYRSIGADLLIKPYLLNIDPYKFDKADECIEAGYHMAKAAVIYIREALDLYDMDCSYGY